MRLTAPTCVIAALIYLAAGLSAAPAAQAGFGIKTFEAGTCKTDTPECTYSAPESRFFTQAAGHPPLGITGFEVNTAPSGEPEGSIKDVRVDIPPGLAVNPQATEQCTKEQFEASTCPVGSEVGSDEITAVVGGILKLGPVSLPMYNIVQPQGVPAEFGFELSVPPLLELHVLIVGGISWYHEAETSENSGVPTGDYHEFFTIKEIPTTLAVVKSRLKFDGTAGNGTFLTLPSTCGTQTSYLHADSYQNQEQFLGYQTVSGNPPKAVSVSGCKEVPFKPEIAVTPAAGQSQYDRPDAATVELKVPQSESAGTLNSSTLKDARITLPEGMTLNPAIAANGLEACSDAQFGKGTANPVTCPSGSKIGEVTIETPDLPAKSLTGSIYVGQPTSTDPESGDEYRIFIDAEAPRYGVSVRLEGHVSANATTGRLTTAVLENPQVPFSDFILTLNGPHTPLANPLMCGSATTNSSLTPYSGNSAAEPFASFPIDFDGKGGACPAPLPFALSQSAVTSPTTGGAGTSFNFSLIRGEGQQYVSKLTTVLPPGLLGKIPSVTLCAEPQAQRGECTAASQIGTVSVSLGSGAPLLSLPGSAYLTGPYGNAPYGLSVVVPAEKVGPFDYGKIVTRAAINVEPFSSRIVVSSQLPTIVGGVPLRLRSIDVNVNRANFAINPTSCAALNTETALTSTFGTNQSLSTPFQATGCSALAFAPKLTASTNAKTSRANGAILVVKVAYPAGPQANIKSVVVTLPKQLPSRLATLNNACPEATFNANPLSCPPLSKVGSATVATPVLPGKLTGTAIFVSHGGASFPDLDLVLQGDGVTVILVGNTKISNGVTTSTYASIPDVPVSSFEVRLPTGKDSVLAANGNLCKSALTMPTTITAQNGKVIKQNTKIAVGDCPITVLSHRIRGRKAIIKAKVFSAGRVTASGKDLSTRSKRPGKAKVVTIEVPLSSAGLRALARHRHGIKLHVRLGFAPKATKIPKSSASVTVLFK
ncbi:MAG TPA: hypothetical protein VHY18_10955 [Solirubrobacteraceae bacterium]|jgi:hypothetical protein|nr:hypothetical protein [Solirubrobacteraceae bacterium]